MTLLVALALFGAPTSCASTGDGAPDRQDATVLNRSFSLWDGTETTLAELVADDGRPVVVNLWATWCTPCLEGAMNRREPWGVWGGQLFRNGHILTSKRRRGRPSKVPRPEDQLLVVPIPARLQQELLSA